MSDTSVASLFDSDFFMGCFFNCEEGCRYTVSCNDTLFTLGKNGITPFLVLDRGASSDEAKKRYYRTHMEAYPDMIYIRYACETPRCIYFRFFYNERFYVLSYEKETGKVLCQKTALTTQNTEDYDGFMSVCPGIENEVDGGWPIWFKQWDPKTRTAVNPTSAATIAWMKEKGMIKNLPDFLQDYPEDGNPVVAVYHFK